MATEGWISTQAIKDSAVQTAELADSAVTAVKIANGTVTAAKLAAKAGMAFYLGEGKLGTNYLG